MIIIAQNRSNIIIKKSIKLVLTIVSIVWVSFSHAAVLIKDKQWPQGLTLNVVFLDGTPELREKVKQIAPIWLKGTNLRFQFFDDLQTAPTKSHIRISFVLQSGSRIGNHGDYLSPYATMNLFDLTHSQISDNASKRLILHEFGHALGFEHEYRSEYWPYGKAPIDIIRKSCLPKMIKIGYSEGSATSHCQKINQPILHKLAHTTAYDEVSIMNYPMRFLMDDGSNIHIVASTELSLLDRYAIQRWYPE